MWYIDNRLIRGFSDAQARLFGWTSANMLSVWRIAMAASLPWLILHGHRTLAAWTFAVAVYLDFVDGGVARYQQDRLGHRTPPEAEAKMSLWRRLRLKGCTITGGWLDPLSDKVLVQAALISLGWDAVPRWMLFIGLALAVALTLARPFKTWLVRTGRRKTADGRANAFGKMKMWMQVAVVGLLFIEPVDVMALIGHTVLTSALLLLALVLAALSLTFHLLPARTRK